jgi:protein-S-isoprenylcysteine O-methyltransferase Ste14
LAVIFFYFAIALEMIVMVTPFTVYFYSVYAPVLNRLEAHPFTAWLTAFFLPHISYTGDPILTALAYLGPILFGLGLVIFFVCAYQVYSAKLLRRGVVSRGLYAWIRHPQYLGLGIAGLGLLLYWPRFMILVLYLTMLFVYYLLARNEEWRMERKFGDAYRNYKAQIGMFLPGEPGGKIFAWFTGASDRRGWALAAFYLAVLMLGIGVAFGLRSYSKTRISTVSENGILTVSLSSLPQSEARYLLRASQGTAELQRLIGRYHNRPGHTLVAYIVPQDYMMQHLIADLGEHEAHHGKTEEGGTIATLKHLGEMYTLKPLRQLRDGRASRERRIIFTEALTAGGKEVSTQRALDTDVFRYPLFFAELRGTEVVLTMEVPRRHAWGTIPVPAF